MNFEAKLDPRNINSEDLTARSDPQGTNLGPAAGRGTQIDDPAPALQQTEPVIDLH